MREILFAAVLLIKSTQLPGGNYGLPQQKPVYMNRAIKQLVHSHELSSHYEHGHISLQMAIE